jgi:hypothetical protein
VTQESFPLLEELLPKEADESAAIAVDSICSRPTAPHWVEGCLKVIALLAASPGPKTAASAMRAASRRSEGRPYVVSYARALVGQACEREYPKSVEAADAIVEGLADAPGELRGAILALGAECTKPSRRALLQATFHSRPTDDDLRVALSDPDGSAAVLDRLKRVDPESRAIIVEAMPTAKSDAPHIRALSRCSALPDEAELSALTESYLHKSDAHGEVADSQILWRFAKVAPLEAAVGRARAHVEEALASASPDERPRLHVALVALGARAHALPASRGLEGYRYQPMGLFAGTEHVIAEGLRNAGCSENEIVQAARAAKSVSDGDRGPLCTREGPSPR